MALLEGQASVRGLVLGGPDGDEDGLIYKLNKFNPFTMTARADQEQKRAWAPGSVGGAEWREELVVPMTVRIHERDAGSWLDRVFELREAFDAIEDSPQEDELRFVIGGREYLMVGRPRVVDPNPVQIGSGISQVELAFACLDPRIYSGVEELRENLPLPQQSGGLTFPTTFPVKFGGVYSGGSVQLEQLGRYRRGAAMTITITGPVVQPRITLADPDGTLHSLRLKSTLGVGEFMVLDTGTETAYLQGTAARLNEVYGDWPLLKRGLSELSWMAAEHSPTARLAVRWRHVW